MLGLASPSALAQVTPAPPAPAPAEAAEEEAVEEGEEEEGEEEEGEEEEGEGEEEEATEEAEATPSTPVLVLPYEGVYRSVPQEMLDAATRLLQKEMDAQDGLQVIRGAVAGVDVEVPSLEPAKGASAGADEAETARDVAAAITRRQSAIAAFEKNAGALEDALPYVQAHHELARTQMLAGDDAAAKATIEVAARLAPVLDLDPRRFPRLYRRWHAEAVERANADRRGSIMVKSVLPGAQVLLDGRPMDVAPVLLERVVPGKHLITARIEGAPAYASTITVEAKKTVEVIATYTDTAGGSAVGTVTDALAKNSVPKIAVTAATEAGKKANAGWVVFGALAKDDDRFRVHTYVVDVNAGQVAELEELSFDLEMLTAESDVLRIVTNARAKIDGFSDGKAEIKKIAKRMRSQNLVNKVNASPEIALAKSPTKSKKKAKGRRPIFRPLKGGSITIKDEEE